MMDLLDLRSTNPSKQPRERSLDLEESKLSSLMERGEDYHEHSLEREPSRQQIGVVLLSSHEQDQEDHEIRTVDEYEVAMDDRQVLEVNLPCWEKEILRPLS